MSILELVKNAMPRIIEHRRTIHSNPELSFKEFQTSEYICSVLTSLNIPFRKVCNTGIVATSGNPKSEKCVAFRAELDALPIQEETGLPCSSQNSGVMHACGHDLHIAMLLGAAEIWTKLELKNICIKLIFQPGEELLPGGAEKMLEENALENPRPQYIFAQHIDPDLELGKIAAAPTISMAATCEFYITINGIATHGATPHKGKDPIIVAAKIIEMSQGFLIRHNNPFKPMVLSICSINGGSANNAFPSQVRMSGTLRCFDEAQRNETLELFSQKCKQLAETFDTTCDVEIIYGYPPVSNSIEAFSIVKKSATSLFGKNSFVQCEPKLWAEDFAYFANEIPACFYFLGIKDSEVTEPLHSPKLAPSEQSMLYGTANLVNIVV